MKEKKGLTSAEYLKKEIRAAKVLLIKAVAASDVEAAESFLNEAGVHLEKASMLRRLTDQMTGIEVR